MEACRYGQKEEGGWLKQLSKNKGKEGGENGNKDKMRKEDLRSKVEKKIW